MTSLTPAELRYDPAVKFSIEERADRWQRRFAARRRWGWIIPADSRPIEFTRLDVAWHDLWTRTIFRGALVPLLLPVVRRLARWLG